MGLTVYRDESFEEWSALYIDGELDTYGDQYRVDERIAEIAGVKYFWGPWLIDEYTPRRTIKEIEAEENRLMDVEQQIADLRWKAHQLLAEADRMEANK